MPIIISFVTSILNMLPVIAIASMGGLLIQKSGIYNIDVEGTMAFGAFLGIFTYYLFNSIWIALLGGFMGGMLIGAILATLTVRYNLDQIVTGFGLWFIAEGSAAFLFVVARAHIKDATFTVSEGFPTFLSINYIFFFSLILCCLLYFILTKTKEGLYVRIAGIDPRVGDYAGIDIFKTRYISVIIGDALVGLSGAFLSVGILQSFSYRIVAGYGWIAFAIILFGKWKPSNVFLGAIFFAAITGIQTRLQVSGILFMPVQFVVALPYIAVVIALTIVNFLGGDTGMPPALGKAFNREKL